MDHLTYAVEAEVEANHWWFVGRRKLFASKLCQYAVAKNSKILDIGTSTGTNLRLLKEMSFQQATGVDLSPEAIRFCELKGLGHVVQGDACTLPFPDETFDLILATDIIEHVDEDAVAVKEIRRVLKNKGKALITVPAFPSLWGLQDEKSFHKRRYRRKNLLNLIQNSGLKILEHHYFNYLLFLPIWTARQIIRMMNVRLESENQVNSPLINWVLTRIFECDVQSAPKIKPPFGVSILLVAEKDEPSHGEKCRV